MGSDDLFKKRRAERQQRKHEFKIPKANSFLIVTEGERTEPLYFNGLKKLIEEKIGGMVDIVEVPTIDVFGEGSSTEKLIEITEKRVKDAKIFYQNICFNNKFLIILGIYFNEKASLFPSEFFRTSVARSFF